MRLWALLCAVCALLVPQLVYADMNSIPRVFVHRNDSSRPIMGVQRTYKAQYIPVEVYEVPGHLTPSLTCSHLESHHSDVIWCELDSLAGKDMPDATPNDPDFNEQYGLTAIQVPEIWDAADFGSSTVIVGVIDTGTDLTHPDIKSNLWVNPKEIASNDIDDDGNGIVDDVHGASFVLGNTSGDCQDKNGHGTFVAGVIGAIGNNGVGVSGVEQVASIMTCQFMDGSGNGWASDAIRCIEYCIFNGAQVLSNSWGGVNYSVALKMAVDQAASQGVLFVASAGNEATDTDVNEHYPSSLPDDVVLSVAASTQTNALWKFTNYGNKSVDLAAPGVEILSLWLKGGYTYLTGTSTAVPHVSGCAALLLAQLQKNGVNISSGLAPQVKQLMLNTSSPLEEEQAFKLKNGVLNCHNAWLGIPRTLNPKP